MNKKIISILVILIIGILLFGCTSDYSFEEIKSANSEDMHLSTALNMCSDMAKYCSEGDSIVRSKLQSSCIQIADQTLDPYYVLEYAKDMC
jgi:hypothetical protein